LAALPLLLLLFLWRVDGRPGGSVKGFNGAMLRGSRLEDSDEGWDRVPDAGRARVGAAAP
jgi:hypothetical protein